MRYPEFFQQAPALQCFDPLAYLLGATSDGILEYRYVDAVKLAGHSCPTVAGAWLMTLKAMAVLYPDSRPIRGGIRVSIRDSQSQGAAGVVGSVIGLLTGAAGEGGFKGIGGKFDRHDLLSYGVAMDAEARFTRVDNGAAVLASYHPQLVPPDPAMPTLMAKMTQGDASAEDRAEFGRLWQDRVKRILIDHANDPELVCITPLSD